MTGRDERDQEQATRVESWGYNKRPAQRLTRSIPRPGPRFKYRIYMLWATCLDGKYLTDDRKRQWCAQADYQRAGRRRNGGALMTTKGAVVQAGCCAAAWHGILYRAGI